MCPPCVDDLGNERVDVTRLEIRVEQAAVEIAVVADRGAEWNVNVKTEQLVTW